LENNKCPICGRDGKESFILFLCSNYMCKNFSRKARQEIILEKARGLNKVSKKKVKLVTKKKKKTKDLDDIIDSFGNNFYFPFRQEDNT